MTLNNTIKAITIAFTAMLPLHSYAETVVNQVGNDISNAASTVGKAAKKTGNEIASAASDTAITAKVKAKLALESDIPLNISVTTAEGVVHLSGTVDTGLQADRIVEVASGVEGVKSVDDSELKVTSSTHFFKDAEITTRAKLKIMELSDKDEISPNTDLSVETTNGEVHIFGNVGDSADIATLKKAISEIEGVKAVKVNIESPKKGKKK